MCGGSVFVDRKLIELFALVYGEMDVLLGTGVMLLLCQYLRKVILSYVIIRGISLLDVVGKSLGRIVQDRLKLVAEDVLPDFQCGFRAGRGCIY